MRTRDRGRARLTLAASRWLAGTTVLAATTLAGAGTATTAHAQPHARAQAQTATVAVAVNTMTVPAVADTYVVAEAPATAYGTTTKLTAATWSTWHSESYLRFRVPALPVGAQVVAARLDVAFQRLDKQPSAVRLRSVTGGWNESTTYADRPTSGAVVSTATLPGQGTTTASFDLTGVVRGGGDYSLAMTNPTPESVASIHSRESVTTGPALTIEYRPATLCGASFAAEPGETYQQAFAREDALFGGLDAVRVFYGGLPQNWPGKLNAGNRPMNISFKAQPSEVLAGTHDAYLRDWFAAAPSDRDIYWTYFHEPEDNIKNGDFTAADYRQAWQRIAGLARAAGNDRLRATLILMGWSVDPASERNWHDYFPGRQYVDVIGWDIYNPSWRNGAYKPVTQMFANVIAASRSESLPFGIAETGSPLVTGDDGTARAAWLRQLTGHLEAEGALFVEYFDHDWTKQAGIDYRLRDAASVRAWREFCS